MPTEVVRSFAPRRLKRRLDGERFGKLVVLRFAGQHRIGGGGPKKMRWINCWLCQCDCGSEPVVVRQHCLLEGKTRSCGCLRRGISNMNVRSLRHERLRRECRKASRVLWEPWVRLLHDTMVARAVGARLLGLRWPGSVRVLGEILNREVPRMPTAEEAFQLAVALNLRGTERRRFEEVARKAREGVEAYERGKRDRRASQWAVELVEGVGGCGV